MQELAASDLWLTGPVWLKDRSLHFATPLIPDECFLEMKSYEEMATHGLITADANPSIDQVIDCTGYNSLSRLLHVTSFVLKFCHSLLRKVHHSSATNNDFLTEAEVLWIQVSQRSLPNRRRFPQWKTQFDLFVVEDKLWHCRGRLQNTNLPWSTIHPILLDEDHHLTTLIIMHCGTKATLTEL